MRYALSLVAAVYATQTLAQYMPVPPPPPGCYFVWSSREHRNVLVCEPGGGRPGRIYR